MALLRWLSLLLSTATAVTASIRGGSPDKVVKVFVLAGQSNMDGHGEVNSTNHTTGKLLNGTLLYQLRDPRTSEEFGKLWDSNKNDWATLSNVKVWFNDCTPGGGMNGSTIPGVPGKDYGAGDLTVGFGGGCNKNFIGPEYGFGFNFPVANDEKVLIVKTAWGGKTIAGDFRPPSSTLKPDPYCRLPKCNPYVVGHYYKVMVQDVKKIMKAGVIGQMYPDLAGYRPELSGFGWFQGWNDGCSLNETAAYETNMVNLITDLRNEFHNPRLPVTIAVSGFLGFTNDEAIRQPPDCWDGPNATKINCDCGHQDRGCLRIDIILSQFAAANLTRHPELGCCVTAMETRGFWREAKYSPNQGQGYHFWHNAETHYLVGKALAQGMLRAGSMRQNSNWQMGGNSTTKAK